VSTLRRHVTGVFKRHYGSRKAKKHHFYGSPEISDLLVTTPIITKLKTDSSLSTAELSAQVEPVDSAISVPEGMSLESTAIE
ncbi:unnamed protein product, partial [Protopolystoma xenopodis]